MFYSGTLQKEILAHVLPPPASRTLLPTASATADASTAFYITTTYIPNTRTLAEPTTPALESTIGCANGTNASHSRYRCSLQVSGLGR